MSAPPPRHSAPFAVGLRRALVVLAAATALVSGPVRADDDATEPSEPGEDAAAELPAPVLIGPRTGEARAAALQKHGGNAATERAVASGLDWLARHAREGGGWDADGFPDACDVEGGAAPCEGIGKGQHGEAIPCPFDSAVSAVATLAFLGAGHAPDAEGDAYARLVEATLSQLRSPGDAWALPLATQCFAEAEAMERRGRFTADVERGVDAILARRQEDGAWGYAAPWRPGSDVPYTALCVQALAAAEDAGVALPEDLADEISAYLESLEWDDKGRLGYLVEGRRYGYTPTTTNAHAAAAIRELLGAGTSERTHARALALIGKKRPVWKISFKEVKVDGRPMRIQIGHLSLYQWWYGTLATFQRGGATWTGWFGKLKGALVGHQGDDGCARGSWDPLGTYERQTGGRVFATALAVLMLEQPYRHRRRER